MKYSQKLSLSRVLMLAAVLMAPIAGAMADNNNGGTNTKKDFTIRLPLNPNPNTSHRPKAPSRHEVNCIYYDGYLTFEFAIPEGECELILSDLSTGEIVAADFDSAMSEPIYVGYHSTASLTVTTTNGHTYTGVW